MKLGKLASNEFLSAYKKLLQEKLPIKTSLKLRKMSLEIQKEIDAYNAEYTKLVQQYGEPVKAEKDELQYVVSKENKDVFFEKINELFNSEFVLTDDMKIGIDELGSEQLSLTVEDLIQLEFIG